MRKEKPAHLVCGSKWHSDDTQKCAAAANNNKVLPRLRVINRIWVPKIIIIIIFRGILIIFWQRIHAEPIAHPASDHLGGSELIISLAAAALGEKLKLAKG